jgi:hypothetical protein
VDKASSVSLHDDLYRITHAKIRPEATTKELRVIKPQDMKKFSVLSDYESYKPMDNSRYRRKIQDGVVDVWWLFDDGGLELLLAHLLTKHHSYLQVGFSCFPSRFYLV